MTIDDLKEAFGTEDGKAAISAFIAENGFKSAEDIKGLEAKKQELLGKVAKSQQEKKELLEAFDKYGIAGVEELEAKLAMLADADSKASDFEKLQRRLEVIERTAKEAEEKVLKEKALRADSEKKAQIISAMKQAHVEDDSLDVLYPYFANLASVVEEGGKISVVVDSDDGQSPIDSYIQEWSKTDKSKAFVKAPSNNGGGATGPGGSSAATLSLAEIAKISDPAKKMEALAKAGYDV